MFVHHVKNDSWYQVPKEQSEYLWSQMVSGHTEAEYIIKQKKCFSKYIVNFTTNDPSSVRPVKWFIPIE